MRFILLAVILLCCVPGAMAGENAPLKKDPFRSTNFPMPRFVTLKEDEVFVRTGPGSQYPVKWVYKQPGRPVEIILEYEHWRKIRDISGKVGWAHKAMLSGVRNGLISGDTAALIKKRARADSETVAQIKPHALVNLKKCALDWCYAKTGGIEGWIEKKNIWGVYRDENLD